MKNTEERCKFLRAMDLIARATNNEDFIYDIWLRHGVPDGEIDDDTPDACFEWLTDDRYFATIMHAFLATMWYANLDGGLYFDDVQSEPVIHEEDDPPEYELDTEE